MLILSSYSKFVYKLQQTGHRQTGASNARAHPDIGLISLMQVVCRLVATCAFLLCKKEFGTTVPYQESMLLGAKSTS